MWKRGNSGLITWLHCNRCRAGSHCRRRSRSDSKANRLVVRLMGYFMCFAKVFKGLGVASEWMCFPRWSSWLCWQMNCRGPWWCTTIIDQSVSFEVLVIHLQCLKVERGVLWVWEWGPEVEVPVLQRGSSLLCLVAFFSSRSDVQPCKGIVLFCICQSTWVTVFWSDI